MSMTIPICRSAFSLTVLTSWEEGTYVITAMSGVAYLFRMTLNGMKPTAQAQTANRTEEVDRQSNFVGCSRWSGEWVGMGVKGWKVGRKEMKR